MKCERCKKVMAKNSKHYCYGTMNGRVHNIGKQQVCHDCWDDWLLKSVEIAERQMGIAPY